MKLQELSEIRVRSRISKEALDERVGKILTERDHDVRLTGPARVRKPDGTLLCIYLPGALKAEMDDAYGILTKIRMGTNNRGDASGAVRAAAKVDAETGKVLRSYTKSVHSALLGNFEASGNYRYCRQTAFSAKNVADMEGLSPLLQGIAKQFEAYVPDRFSNQMREVRKTQPEWIIPGTPFTTVTVNNSYSTGTHVDAGDLHEGFSCLGVARRGPWTGGIFTFPEYRVAVDLQDGDLVLMDAHEYHGNTQMVCQCGTQLDKACPDCAAERISVVAYFRTRMVECGTASDEEQRRIERAESKISRGLVSDPVGG